MLRHRFNQPSLFTSGVGALIIGASLGMSLVYNSEEHKLMVDWGVSMVDQRSAQLPSPTGFVPQDLSPRNKMYMDAKWLAVGITSNNPGDYSEDTKKVQDNSYWDRYAQREYNLKLYVPNESEISPRTLLVSAWTNTEEALTFGELVALYGDYRRTVFCESGRCYLTNSDRPVYRNPYGHSYLPGTIYFEYGEDCFGLKGCGWEPDPVSTVYYLHAIGSGLVPPFGAWGNTVSNTAWEEEELDAGWWGDEMVRIANTNDWHFSSAAIAWYVGMHRLALLYVERARTDSRYWNQALHYEANGLHALTDLFAFGHIVTNRDLTSSAIIRYHNLEGDRAYRWMENVLKVGGGTRSPQGVLAISAELPSIQDDIATLRGDMLPTYANNSWGFQALDEKGLHDRFNAGGATVINLKRQEFPILGDFGYRRLPGTTRAIMAEAVRASVQSLFDAYESGVPIDQVGSPGSSYFDALLNVPVFVKADAEHLFDGQWTRYAATVDAITGAGLAPPAPLCVMPYIGAGIAPPPPRQSPCSEFTPRPSGALVVEELLRANGVLAKGDRAYLDAIGNKNNRFDVGDFLAWVRVTGATPANPTKFRVVIQQGGQR